MNSRRALQSIALGAGLCAGSSSLAQEAPSRHVILAWSAQHLADDHGRSLSLDWVGAEAGDVYSLGAELAEVSSTRWNVFHASLAKRLGSRVTWAAGMGVGPGSTDNDRFTYVRANASLSIAVGDAWSVGVKDTYVDIEPVRGHLLTMGAAWHGSRVLSLAAELTSSASGNLDDRMLNLRADRRLGTRSLAAGISTGTSNNRLIFNLPSASASETRLRQLFLSFTIPVGQLALTFSLDAARLGDLDRVGLSVLARMAVL